MGSQASGFKKAHGRRSRQIRRNLVAGNKLPRKMPKRERGWIICWRDLFRPPRAFQEELGKRRRSGAEGPSGQSGCVALADAGAVALQSVDSAGSHINPVSRSPTASGTSR
jgi:hypothetical protein